MIKSEAQSKHGLLVGVGMMETSAPRFLEVWDSVFPSLPSGSRFLEV